MSPQELLSLHELMLANHLEKNPQALSNEFGELGRLIAKAILLGAQDIVFDCQTDEQTVCVGFRINGIVKRFHDFNPDRTKIELSLSKLLATPNSKNSIERHRKTHTFAFLRHPNPFAFSFKEEIELFPCALGFSFQTHRLEQGWCGALRLLPPDLGAFHSRVEHQRISSEALGPQANSQAHRL